MRTLPMGAGQPVAIILGFAALLPALLFTAVFALGTTFGQRCKGGGRVYKKTQ